MNLVEATVSRADGSLFLDFSGNRLELNAQLINDHPALASYAGRSLILGVRPESMDDATLVTRQKGSGTLRVVVDLREALGSDVLVHFRLNAPPVLTEDTKELAHDSETAVPLRAEEQERSIFVARLNARSRVREGDTVDLAVDTRGLHFFDPDTGASIRAAKPT